MLPQPDHILNCLGRHMALSEARQYVVGYSGGLDSTVLLDLARRALPRKPGASLLAVHVDHNLHPSSNDWSGQCAETARRFGVRYTSCRVQVSTADGESPEAAARRARYAALAEYIGPGDVLMSAHHLDDQVETVLLQLTRGAGVAGLAGMPECTAFRDGWYLRPFLSLTRDDLAGYARRYRLHWIEDPGNTQRRFDRNFLRHDILPGLFDRWPGAANAIARSAKHCAAATRVLREIGTEDARLIADGDGIIDLPRLATLSRDRPDNALRCWLRIAQLPLPSTAHLSQLRKLLRSDGATGCVSWPGCELRRYRARLYAMRPMPKQVADYTADLAFDTRLELPAGLGQLQCSPTSSGGLDPDRCGEALSVRFRAGGEILRPVGSAHRRELRLLFQEAGIVPWMRDRIPLVYAGDRLAAVADLWLEQGLAVDEGARGLGLSWENHPALY